MMISRNEKGKLQARTLDIQILFDELFYHCENEQDVEWVNELLESALTVSYEESLERFESEV